MVESNWNLESNSPSLYAYSIPSGFNSSFLFSFISLLLFPSLSSVSGARWEQQLSTGEEKLQKAGWNTDDLPWQSGSTPATVMNGI